METNNVVVVSDIEQIINDALGYRSPCHSLQHGGNTSPGQGRSVREFEEQMASLRKENFNLKLRIYFLEEKIPGYSSANADGHESLMKQNVDLKVDIEVLRKELQEKQALLCEAAKAMELMEEQQKATEEKSHGIIEELNQRIQCLEMDSKHLEKIPAGQQDISHELGHCDFIADVDTLQKVRILEGQVKQFELKTEQLVKKNKELEMIVSQKEKSIKDQEKKVKELKFQLDELQEQLDEKVKEALNKERKYEEGMKMEKKMQIFNDEKITLLETESKTLKTDIEKLKAELEQERSNSEDRSKKLREQQHWMEEMQFTILNKMKANAKMSRTIEEHETLINELKTEQQNASRENTSLKDIIVKLEHAKFKDLANTQGLEIYLGKKRYQKEERRLENRKTYTVSPRTFHEENININTTTTNGYLANPLFPSKTIDCNSNNHIGEGSHHTTEFKLKQKLSVYLNKTTGSKCLPSSRYCIKERRNIQNTACIPITRSKQHYEKTRSIQKFPNEISVDIESAIKAVNHSVGVVTKNTWQDYRITSPLQSSSSETSLMSCCSSVMISNTIRSKTDDEIIVPKTISSTVGNRLKGTFLEKTLIPTSGIKYIYDKVAKSI